MAQLPLDNGCTAVFEAIDQASGMPVAGVKIINPVVYGYNLTTEEEAPPTIVSVAPEFLPVPVDLPTGAPDAEPAESAGVAA